MEDILKLKRLLVTMKQQYEKSLHQAQLQLQVELDEKVALQSELELLLNSHKKNKTDTDQEIASLKNQQISLKEMLKKLEAENSLLREEQKKHSQEMAEIVEKKERLIKSEEVLSPLAREKEKLQDKYELLKEEWKQLSDQLEDALELKNKAEESVKVLTQNLLVQETECRRYREECIHQEKNLEHIEAEKQIAQALLEESENNLHTAQQHLAKKVKETTLQSEHIDELQNRMIECIETIDAQKGQITQLQANLELYQKQEQRLQEQLHEALKGTDSKIVKWEEKYFQMVEKWQLSEERLGELKRVEEKYLQIKRFLNALKPYLEDTPSNLDVNENFRMLNADFESQVPPSGEEFTAEGNKKWDLFGMSHQ